MNYCHCISLLCLNQIVPVDMGHKTCKVRRRFYLYPGVGAHILYTKHRTHMANRLRKNMQHYIGSIYSWTMREILQKDFSRIAQPEDDNKDVSRCSMENIRRTKTVLVR